jgi:hypothetical protein
MFIRNGACTEFSTFWLSETLIADKTNTIVRYNRDMGKKIDDAQWIRSSLGNVSYIPHRAFLRSENVKFVDMISHFDTINDRLMDLFFHERKTGYLIFGATHTVALVNTGLKIRYFDPNFGSAAFYSLDHCLSFIRRSWAENYADGDTFIEKYRAL